MESKNNRILLVQNKLLDQELRQNLEEINYQLIPASFLDFKEIYQSYKVITAQETPFCLTIIDNELTTTDKTSIPKYQLVCEHLRLIESYGNPIVIMANQQKLKEINLLKMKADMKITKPLTIEMVQEIFVALKIITKSHKVIKN